MQSKPCLYIITSNHFDLTWRRCWNRRFEFKGQSFVSYTEIEDYYFTDNLALAAAHPEYKFEAECTAVIRQYLRRHPEHLGRFRKLAADGRFTVTAAGDNIIDSNMVLGESIVRNFVTGISWLEKNLGIRPQLGARNDAFGNSAQIPQIFRGCGIKWVRGISYSPIKGRYFRGLDGSVICTAMLPEVAWGGGWMKYPPCPFCRGFGCRKCRGRGIDQARFQSVIPRAIREETLAENGAGLVMLAPEELLPNPGIIDWARKLGRKYEVRFALQEETLPHVQQWLAQVDNPPPQEVHPSVEANPNNSGTWVTRIKLKQHCRRQEYAVSVAEALSSLAALRGVRYPRASFAAIWEKLLFTMFHDAVTSTHVDAAYAELCDVIAEIDRATAGVRRRALRALTKPHAHALSVINPLGHEATEVVSAEIPTRSPDVTVADSQGRAAKVLSCERLSPNRARIEFVAQAVPPLGSRTYFVKPSRPSPLRQLRQPVIENQRFRVEADERGIVRIFDKKLRADICRQAVYRPNEFILEYDAGSPWATLHPDQSRIPMGGNTELIAAEATAAFQRLRFRVCSPFHPNANEAFTAQTSVTLVRGIDRVHFETRAHWDAHNLRVRVAFPVPRPGKGWYGIPYGILQRDSYTPTFHSWTGANGDWPAVNWAGVQTDRFSVALLNKGLPSNRVDSSNGDSLILLSVLRSPAIPTYLHEPGYYTMTDYDGMRDAGDHYFEYAVTAYDKPFAESAVVPDAEQYNAGLLAATGVAHLPPAPRLQSTNARLAALKWAEQGNALILRLHEFRGRAGTAKLSLPFRVRRALKVNLLERDGVELSVERGAVQVELRPWEIATIRLEI